MIRMLVFGIATIALLGCGSDEPTGTNDPPADGAVVTVSNNQFNPSTITVPLNATVTWQWNSGGVAHNVTFTDQTTSGNLTSGTYARAFDAAGNHTYLCTLHGPSMSGVVNVTAATGGGGGAGGGGAGDGGGGGGGGGYP
jgi:plastocyanin